jgi:hypothetical protein
MIENGFYLLSVTMPIAEAEADETSIQPSWAWKMAGGHVCVWLGRVLSDQSIKLDQFVLGRAIGIILAYEMPRGRLGDKAPE